MDGRTAVRTLCNASLRTASGPEGSSAKQILPCAAGRPDRGSVHTRFPPGQPHIDERAQAAPHPIASGALTIRFGRDWRSAPTDSPLAIQIRDWRFAISSSD
jgi:hypothetical protein